MDGELSLKGAWSGHVNYLNFGGHQSHHWTADARVVKFCIQVGYAKY